jgi:hypothetical protein
MSIAFGKTSVVRTTAGGRAALVLTPNTQGSDNCLFRPKHPTYFQALVERLRCQKPPDGSPRRLVRLGALLCQLGRDLVLLLDALPNGSTPRLEPSLLLLAPLVLFGLEGRMQEGQSVERGR